MPGTDPPVCRAHLGTSGRRTVLTAELAEHLATLLSAGSSLVTALAVAGVASSTYHDWMERGAAEDATEQFRDFRLRMDGAKQEGIARNVTIVATAAQRDWRAAAWLLERQDPDSFSRVRARPEGGDPDAGKDAPAAAQVDGDGERDPYLEDELRARRAATA